MNTKAETAEKGSEVINGSLQEAGGLLDGALLRSGSQRPREGSEVINGSLQEAGTEEEQGSGWRRGTELLPRRGRI